MGEITESYIEIMNLVHAYPERIDAGDFAGVGELFADGVFETEGGEPLAARRSRQTSSAGRVAIRTTAHPIRGTVLRIRSSKSTRREAPPWSDTT